MLNPAINVSPSSRSTAPSPQSWLLYRFNVWHGMFFLLYVIVAILFYFWAIVPYLNAEDLLAPRLLADSITYQKICSTGLSWGDWYFLRDAGPCINLFLFGQSSGLVTLANALLMTIPSVLMSRTYGVNASKVLLLLLINPMSFFSLFGANKEAFGIACTMCLLIFLRRRTVPSLVATLIFSMLTRLPMFAVVVTFLLIQPVLIPQRFSARPWRRFWMVSLALLLSLSIATFIFGDKPQVELLGNVLEAADNSNSTLVSLGMETYTHKGLFVLTYIVRLLLNLFGALYNIAFVSIETHGVYYVVGVIGSSFMFFVMSVLLISRYGRHLLLKNDSMLPIWLFVVFSTLILCVSPVIQHRYFFQLYPALILALVSRCPVKE